VAGWGSLQCSPGPLAALRGGPLGKEREEEAGVGEEGRRDCAVLKIPLKSPGPGPSLTLRQIDTPAGAHD